MEQNVEFAKIAKKYGMNPLFLRGILPLRVYGHDNTQIAVKLGISRITVNKYMKMIRDHENDADMHRMINLGLSVMANGDQAQKT